MKSVGTQLREARLKQGWTLKAAAKATKIREDQLQKLENDDFSRFHAPTYVKGFVKNYAKVLGLNVRELNEQIEQILDVEGEVTYQRSGGIDYVPELVKAHREFNPRSLALVMAGLVLVSLFGIFGYELIRVVRTGAFKLNDDSVVSTSSSDKKSTDASTKSDGGDKKSSDDPGSAPAATLDKLPVAKALPAQDQAAPTVTVPAVATAPATPTSPPAMAEAAANKLALMAKEECWVRICVLENNQPRQIFEGLLAAGSTQEFEPAAKYLIKARDVSLIEVSLNGKSYAINHSDDHLPAEFSVPSGDTN